MSNLEFGSRRYDCWKKKEKKKKKATVTPPCYSTSTLQYLRRFFLPSLLFFSESKLLNLYPLVFSFRAAATLPSRDLEKRREEKGEEKIRKGVAIGIAAAVVAPTVLGGETLGEM